MDESPGAAELFERLSRGLVGGGMTEELLAEDVVVEMPFAPAGLPHRVEGRAEFLAFAEAGRAALRGRIEEVRNVVVHQTTDPDVVVVEYELVGSLADGRRASAPFIGVLAARDGRVARWREYQNPLVMAEAMGRSPGP